jgi:putative transposase
METAICCSCYQRRPGIETARRRDLFLRILETVRQKYQFVVVGYVVMSEHFHLLISEPHEGTLSVVMHALTLSFARRVLGQMRRRRGSAQTELFPAEKHPVWQARFYDFNVWSKRKRVEKLRYIHQNPVKRRLVASPELWRWSSHRAYALGEAGLVRVNAWEVLKLKVRAPAA